MTTILSVSRRKTSAADAASANPVLASMSRLIDADFNFENWVNAELQAGVSEKVLGEAATHALSSMLASMIVQLYEPQSHDKAAKAFGEMFARCLKSKTRGLQQQMFAPGGTA